MFTKSPSTFTPSHELYMESEPWGDDQAPDIFRPNCEYIAVVKAVHNEDYVNKVIKEQVEELQRRGLKKVAIVMMASPLFKQR